MEIWDELTWRGLIARSTDEDALREHLAQGPVTFYVGFDPTAPSLHIGSLVQLLVARHLQRAGHRPLLLVGGSTGQIGDPKESGERTLNSPETVAGWVESIRAQVERFVSFEGEHAAVMVNNLDWTGPMSVLTFLRDIGKHFPVNRMLARDVVRNRLEDGISYTEFSYVLLQSMDFLELFRRHDCTLQFGGSDQWGNLTAGVELVRRAEGGRVHALATPLITKADGTKFGKTETGTVWLDRDLMSPFAFHQFWLNVEDAKVVDHLKVFTDLGPDEIAELEASLAEKPWAREAQRRLADEATTLAHGEEAARDAAAAGTALFGRGDGGALHALAERTLADLTRSVPSARYEAGEEPTVARALVDAGVVESLSAARRAAADGGLYVNNERVDDADASVRTCGLLHGQFAVLRRGKKAVGMAVLPAI